MARDVPEWVGKNDNQAIPPRVKERIHLRAGGICAICTLPVVGKLRPAFDHKQALKNGGPNRESNVQLLCEPCHDVKTKKDVAEKAVTYRKRLKHIGVKPNKGRPMPGSKASGFRKRMNGRVEVR